MTTIEPAHHPSVRVTRDDAVVTVTIDAPSTRNACTGDMWVAIGRTFRDVAHSGARVVVLTGANGDFCAGADLGGLDSKGGDDALLHADVPPMVSSMRVLSDVVLAVHDCPLPVVAKVDGLCIGAGLGLALAADMLWCSDRARFAAIFVRRGLSMDFGSSWLLRQRIGVHQAKDLAFTGRMVAAHEAAELGLVNAVVAQEELDERVAGIASQIASGPPIAISMTKRQLNGAWASTLPAALELEALAQSVNVTTDDTREALASFIERRDPRFHGR